MRQFTIHLDKDDPRLGEAMVWLGQEYPEHRDDILAVARAAKDGVEINVLAVRPGRSRVQEGYYRRWCRAFAEFCGLHEEEMHDEILGLAFGWKEELTKWGPRRRPNKRSADVTVDEYSYLIETLIDTAAQFGFVVEPPVRRLPGRDA